MLSSPWISLKEHLYLLNFIGAILTLMGIFLLIPLIPLWLLDEGGPGGISVWTFLFPAIVSITSGLAIQRGFTYQTPSVRGAMLITALGWIVVCLLGAIPYQLGLHKTFIDAFFESVSGFTTTGITVFEGLDGIPGSILFWRSFTQWLGGLGILSFFILVSFRGGSAAAALFSAEGHKINTSRPVPGIFNTMKILWGLYIMFTISSFLCFWLAGMNLFDAVNHCFTCISTGGFSTHDASLSYWSQNNYPHAWLIEYVAVLFMLAGGISFLIHFAVITGDFKALFTGFEIRFYWMIAGGAVLLVCLDHYRFFAATQTWNLNKVHDLFRTALFQVASLLTSTGYLTTDINAPFFPSLSKQVFFTLMIVGGCVGSTAGGLKVLRIGLLSKLFAVQLRRIFLPRAAVVPLVISGKVISPAEIERVAALFWMWMTIIVGGAFVTCAFSNLGPWQGLSGMASAMGNMGPFYFSVHEMVSLHWVIKLTYIFGMLAGRLEIIPLAVLFGTLLRRR